MVEAHEREDLAAYALGLLDPAERARVEAHLRACTICGAELAAYRNAVELLPEALPVAAPPPQAWDAIAARIRLGRRDRARAGSLFGRVFGARPWLQPALLAVFGAMVLGLIGWNASLQARLSNQNTPLNAIAGELASNTVVDLIAQPGVIGPGGRLVMSHDRKEGGLVVAGLPALLAGQSYQIWFVRTDQSRAPADTFAVDSRGQAVFLVNVPQPADSYSGVAITAEPEAGSPTPTGPDLLAGLIYEQHESPSGS